MDEVLQHFADERGFMGSVLVARDEEILFERSYGLANIEWNQPNSPTTKFRLASITKQFTAAAILILEERGQLSLDDRIRDYLPDLPVAWNEITIFHLLAHQSGIPELLDLPNAEAWVRTPTSVQQTITYFMDQPLAFEPGLQALYTNSGYIVAGYLIEQVTGQTYERFLKQNVFEPLGMTNTGYDSDAIIYERAAGYVPGASPLSHVNAPYLDQSFPHAAGALYSTTRDLLVWEQALFGGEVLSAESLLKMTTPYLGNYGLGAEIKIENGRRVIDHGGGTNGFQGVVAYYPDQRVTMIALSNFRAQVTQSTFQSLRALVRGEQVILPVEREFVSLSQDKLERFVGTYTIVSRDGIIPAGMNQWFPRGRRLLSGPIVGTYTIVSRDGIIPAGMNINVSVANDQLSYRLAFAAAIPARAMSDTRFFAPSMQTELEFEPDAGQVKVTLIEPIRRGHLAERIEVSQEFEIDSSTLDGYTGTYSAESGLATYRVTLESDDLIFWILAPEGAPNSFPAAAPLLASGQDVFSLLEANWQIEFVRDGSEQVEAMVLTQDGQRTRAARR